MLLIPKLRTPAWTSPLNSRLPYPMASLTLLPASLIGHLELNMSEAELIALLKTPSPYQEICWLHSPDRIQIHYSSSPHHHSPDPSPHHLLPGLFLEHSNWSSCFYLCFSTVCSQQSHSDTLKFLVRSCNFTPQNSNGSFHSD